MKSVNNVKNITLAMRTYSGGNGFVFPENHEGRPYTSSQDAFAFLSDLVLESSFWIETSDPNSQKPNENGTLEKGECIYGYVSGLNEKSLISSPLVFEGLLNRKDFSCTDHMPWLSEKRAVVGFVDGHVEQVLLTSPKAGATMQSQDRTMSNILLEISKGGALDTKPSNVLLPIGY